MTPAGIEPATFRFVAQHLNHCATAVPKMQGISNIYGVTFQNIFICNVVTTVSIKSLLYSSEHDRIQCGCEYTVKCINSDTLSWLQGASCLLCVVYATVY